MGKQARLKRERKELERASITNMEVWRELKRMRKNKPPAGKTRRERRRSRWAREHILWGTMMQLARTMDGLKDFFRGA